jgi:uncharacterized membrane protein
MAKTRAFAWYDPRQARGRFLVGALTGVVAAILVPGQLSWPERLVCGWDAGGTVLLTLAWLFIARSTPTQTRKLAATEDPGRNTVTLLVIAMSAFSLFAATVAMRHAKSLTSGMGTALVAACGFAVVTAWIATHSAYTLRYAHLYYRDDLEGEGGLVFPGDSKPSYLDFAYFAFVIGMCFQVSDVSITSPTIRRGALAHSLLSFVYNTAIVALTLNLVFGFMG